MDKNGKLYCVDEKGLFNKPNAVDAPSYTNNNFKLAAGRKAYGNLDGSNILGNEDVYSLGLLSTGNYTLDVDSSLWDFSSNSYSWFNVYDVTGGNNFVKNGVEIDASAGAWVSYSDLANTTIKCDSQASEQTLYFQTYDGTVSSAWDSMILTKTVEI